MDGSNPRPAQVGIVAPPLIAWGLERLVQSGHPRIELVMQWASAHEAIARPAGDRCDILVMDLGAEESLDTISAIGATTTASLLLVTGSADLGFLDKAILCGARGVVQKAEPPAMLIKAIERVADGEYWIDRSAIGRIFLEIARQNAPAAPEPEREKIATLTARERRTIGALVGDASAPGKILAQRLCISEHTLRNHLTSIYQKLGLANRLDLYAYAMRNGLAEQADGSRAGPRMIVTRDQHGA